MRKMVWVVWRQDRAALATLLAVLAALTGILIVSGSKIRAQYAALGGWCQMGRLEREGSGLRRPGRHWPVGFSGTEQLPSRGLR